MLCDRYAWYPTTSYAIGNGNSVSIMSESLPISHSLLQLCNCKTVVAVVCVVVSWGGWKKRFFAFLVLKTKNVYSLLACSLLPSTGYTPLYMYVLAPLPWRFAIHRGSTLYL